MAVRRVFPCAVLLAAVTVAAVPAFASDTPITIDASRAVAERAKKTDC